ncbi:MAG TPA: MFS transporter [Solirubrobacterales bacterium]|nr:MFS transporter [Solirubrobacterales bacterium]
MAAAQADGGRREPSCAGARRCSWSAAASATSSAAGACSSPASSPSAPPRPSALAPSDELLIGARALQGIAGALLVPGSLALVAAAFEGEARGRAVGTWTAWTGIATVFGPAGGGGLIDLTSWRAIALSALGLGGPVFALIEQPSHGWGDPLVWVPLAGGLFFLTLYLQQVVGYSALVAGLATTPISVLLFLLSPRFGKLASGVGPRLPMTAGPVVAALGLLLMTRIGADPSYVGDVLPAVVVFGLGLSATVAPLTATVLDSVEERRVGIASGVNNGVSRVAGLLAIAVLGAIVSAQFDASAPGVAGGPLTAAAPDASTTAFHLGCLVAALLTFAGGLVSALGIENPRRREALASEPA